MKVVWLIFNTIAASWFSYVILMNPVLQAVMGKWGGGVVADRTALALFGALAALQFAVAISVYLFVSIGAAVVVTSLAAFGWALMSYFLLQRFADPSDRPLMVHNVPMFYPLVALGGFISSNLSVILFLGWRWVFLPIVIWLLLGFLCAEISIRRLMRRKYDRNLAIYSINNVQGRVNIFSLFKNREKRYPFP